MPPLAEPCHTNPTHAATGLIDNMKSTSKERQRAACFIYKQEKGENRTMCENRILALQKHENAGVPSLASAFLSSPRPKHRPRVLTAISILSA